MNIRKPAVAGQFYPLDPKELSKTIEDALANVPDSGLSGTPVAFLVPHAGYVFSAQTAAHSYHEISLHRIKNVILFGNSHNFPLQRGAVFPEGHFKTPLGIVEINKELAAKIIKNSPLFEANIAPHIPEHSLEVQVPFLQSVLKEFKIVPILMGSFSLAQCKEAGEAVAKAVNELGIAEKTVIVISSDMSHYPAEQAARSADQEALKALERFDPVLLQKTVNGLMSKGIPELHCVYCGEESVYTGMYAAKALGAKTVKVLNYSNSAKVSCDPSRVVGYGAAVFLK